MQWIVIPRWEEFQHRDAARVQVPTWIKLMTRLLSDQAYLGLSGHRRAVLHGLWLEYARSLRQLTDDTASLSRRLHLKVTTSDLQALNDAGFVHFSASKPASTNAGTSAGTEKRREEVIPLPPYQPTRRPPRERRTETNGNGHIDYAAKAAELYQRTHDREAVDDWLAGITRLTIDERDRILEDVCG